MTVKQILGVFIFVLILIYFMRSSKKMEELIWFYSEIVGNIKAACF